MKPNTAPIVIAMARTRGVIANSSSSGRCAIGRKVFAANPRPPRMSDAPTS
jgi:hypothetical protein